ncbi:cytochrome P450 protein [Rutstroemia sp. NJR-2017a BBW]|nr:cytochrome P450 protein [Rutstroemia sp. NJR-2017a BBW]
MDFLNKEILLAQSSIYVLYHLGIGLYNITLHPLAKVPGPKLRGAFEFPRYWEIWTGDVAATCKELHDRYGATVHIAPSTVSFNNAEAWQDYVIYGQRAGKKPFQKDKDVYFSSNDGIPDINFLLYVADRPQRPTMQTTLGSDDF